MALKQTFGAKPGVDRDCMTSGELGLFREERKRGGVSFFRVGHCLGCSTEIHKSKQYCSKQCKQGDEEDDGDGETEQVD